MTAPDHHAQAAAIFHGLEARATLPWAMVGDAREAQEAAKEAERWSASCEEAEAPDGADAWRQAAMAFRAGRPLAVRWARSEAIKATAALIAQYEWAESRAPDAPDA